MSVTGWVCSRDICLPVHVLTFLHCAGQSRAKSAAYWTLGQELVLHTGPSWGDTLGSLFLKSTTAPGLNQEYGCINIHFKLEEARDGAGGDKAGGVGSRISCLGGDGAGGVGSQMACGGAPRLGFLTISEVKRLVFSLQEYVTDQYYRQVEALLVWVHGYWILSWKNQPQWTTFEKCTGTIQSSGPQVPWIEHEQWDAWILLKQVHEMWRRGMHGSAQG
ncbi:hypothetical protein B0H14DRAFT_2655089 [Mycena olivaceomarginata]|nr:hypothetical protein B0H14DRAFT_2655089 [Mycena olivaceomarginata]